MPTQEEIFRPQLGDWGPSPGVYWPMFAYVDIKPIEPILKTSQIYELFQILQAQWGYWKVGIGFVMPSIDPARVQRIEVTDVPFGFTEAELPITAGGLSSPGSWLTQNRFQKKDAYFFINRIPKTRRNIKTIARGISHELAHCVSDQIGHVSGSKWIMAPTLYEGPGEWDENTLLILDNRLTKRR